ncbi:MAG: tRNA (guanosine(46)-N7)-methyltransferase TrmB [Ruminococcaceae bacterium]|nr:tRNA (guanosine(46)-N7)-methyltransferase TrmB [Oscillospiraceae bacterium]
MRMRHKKHERERMEAVQSYLVRGPEALSERQPLHLEIGCGKGGFIAEIARRNPDIQFLAVEKVSSVLVLAMEKAAAAELSNVQFFSGDVMRLAEYPLAGKCERIYLNFSDPWPRMKHAKRRLTAPSFLSLYKKLLTPDGTIVMKTDNVPLFEYSLLTLPENGFVLSETTRDLHALHDPDNVVTEYEANFSSQGIPICRLIARRS